MSGCSLRLGTSTAPNLQSCISVAALVYRVLMASFHLFVQLAQDPPHETTLTSRSVRMGPPRNTPQKKKIQS
eukprot:6150716-Amphidinium_carterae.1